MADDSGIRFIHKDGRIIPIRSAAASAGQAAGRGIRKVGGKLASLHKQTRFAHGAVVGAGAAIAAQHGSIKSNHPEVKVNQKLNLLGLGLSIGTGVLGAATLSHGAKSFIVGSAASHAIDALGVGLNVASVAGNGHKAERAKQAAKQEARNFAVGNAVYLAGAVATKGNRAALVAGAKGTLKYAGKTLAFARKVLRVGAL